jgi:hypothetical protein
MGHNNDNHCQYQMNLKTTSILTASMLALTFFANNSDGKSNIKSDLLRLSGDDKNLINKFKECPKTNCSALYGTLKNNLVVYDVKGERERKGINLVVSFENCYATIKNISYSVDTNKRWGEHASFKTNDDSTLSLTCGEETISHKRFSMTNANGEFGLKLRKFKNSYTHLGDLQLGIIPLPNN